MSPEPVLTAGGPDVLPNPVPEPDPELPKPDPTPEPTPVPPLPEPAPTFSFFGLKSPVPVRRILFPIRQIPGSLCLEA
jgi:hypothetical protein